MTPKEALLEKRDRPRLDREGALSSGSTLLNLACTDTPHFAFLKGYYYYWVGDTASGKTFGTLTCFSEACNNPAFDKHLLIHDDVEGGALMDFSYFFGKKAAKRIRPPAYDRKNRPVHSTTVESFYYHISDLIADGEPFVYVLDSQDALDSTSAVKKFRRQKRAAEANVDAAGSYGDGKAKFHSEHLRHVLAGLKKTKSILIIIGQTRDNIGTFSFEKKTRSGGKALRFYANTEIWTSVAGKLKRRVRGRQRTIGVKCLAEVRKNRVTGKIGKDRAVIFPIYYDYGIDDVGACVDYLVGEGAWRKVKKKGEVDEEGKRKIYDARELLFQGSREEIIKHIEEEGLEKKVRQLVAKVWEEVEDECRSDRKKRYE